MLLHMYVVTRYIHTCHVCMYDIIAMYKNVATHIIFIATYIAIRTYIYVAMCLAYYSVAIVAVNTYQLAHYVLYGYN